MSNFYDQMFWIVVGIVATKCFEFFTYKIKSTVYTLWLKIRIRKIISSQQNEVLSLQNGIPYFETENITLRPTNYNFILPIPEEFKCQLKPDFNINEVCCFNVDFTDIFLEVETQTGIPGLGSRLKTHCEKVAKDFIAGINGCYFNNIKFGVLNISPFSRKGREEKQEIELQLYFTDYFTHRVMRSVYQELKQENHSICQSNILDEDNMNKYNYFTTSIAVNTLLVLKAGLKEEIVLTERSRNVINAEGANANRKYVSISEGISEVDFDRQFGTIKLPNCVYRGLEEELGVKEEMIQMETLKFYDLYLDREKFEIGFTSLVKAKERYKKDILIDINFIRNLPKSDGYESTMLYNIALNNNEIKKFIKENEFIPQGLYSLRMICARESIYL